MLVCVLWLPAQTLGSKFLPMKNARMRWFVHHIVGRGMVLLNARQRGASFLAKPSNHKQFFSHSIVAAIELLEACPVRLLTAS
jgi:hypothetical protein